MMSAAGMLVRHSHERQREKPCRVRGKNTRISRGVFAIGLVMALSVLFGMPEHFGGMLTSVAAAVVQDDWKKEFEDICSRTGDSMSLTPDELKGLVTRCDALKPRIEQLDETQKKVYLKRLKNCRDLLAFVLESKEGK